ncbi:2-polyprenyl-3-methyl-5-hydroxy-6-metoxy-1,4-benzoquinol methylase [Bernardetia litoralis DSM 6794]|uniref:2-polyprenyl-3-methyl-5-hydroxy-6-metoxy-1, 4-benzoquinol methylase n=1 Tax=Bernardetia litoralis (strain ATCC 23117 / DSM 6794 / NBRC 15988 / NCIMB 1366 / Fx l1 / Sio-4) TaxID=880071 RepID=I4AI94_BERLS|nr:methyltransferase domain-containing protein [Bernardetia litoralis]AFM03679.1 2-polyprenyl-3-methyl-5-hydroxy-6-metoxy-1,4-benzoquinol methylase [Bernardetia litoralis DSM 6794]
MNFKTRSYKKELMDDLNLASKDLKKNLDELEFINTTLGGYKVLTSALDTLYKENKISSNKENQNTKMLTLADIGSGGGDTLRQIARWFDKKNIETKLTGIDANDFMINYAQNKSKKYPQINYEKLNVFDIDSKNENKYDWATMSLFCHHFTDEELILIFKNIQKLTSKGFIINDLHRNPIAYYSIYFLTRLFNGSYLVKNDAPLSVLRAFKKQDLINLLDKAGIEKYRIKWQWAFRFQVIVEK